MVEIKKLNDEELKDVVGGSTTEDASNELKCKVGTFTGFVGKYAEGYRGRMFYFVSHDGDEYYYGRLLDSFESEKFFSTERTHQIKCAEHNGTSFYGFVQLSGDDYWLYTGRN